MKVQQCTEGQQRPAKLYPELVAFVRTPALATVPRRRQVWFRYAGQQRPEYFSAELAVFNPADGTVRTAAPLLEPRGNAALVALPEGRLMLLGGRIFDEDEAVVRPPALRRFATLTDVEGAAVLCMSDSASGS